MFSEAFYQLQQLKKKPTSNRFKLVHAAEEVKVEYHRMKRIFAGSGHAEISHNFMGYFNMEGIDIQPIRYSQCIVSVAYMDHLTHIANTEKHRKYPEITPRAMNNQRKMTRKNIIEIASRSIQEYQARNRDAQLNEYAAVLTNYSSMTIAQLLKAIVLETRIGLRDDDSGLALVDKMQAIEANELAHSYYQLWQHMSTQHEIRRIRQDEPIVEDPWDPCPLSILDVATQVGLPPNLLRDLYQGKGTAHNLGKLLRWYSFQLPSQPTSLLYAVVAVMSSGLLINYVYELMTTNPTLLLQQRDTLFSRLTQQ